MSNVMWQASARIIDDGQEKEFLMPLRSSWDSANKDAGDLLEKNETLSSVSIRRYVKASNS